MKKIFVMLLVCITCIKGLSITVSQGLGVWSKENIGREPGKEIPFHFDSFDDTIVITNENPDRCINCEIVNEYGTVLKSCSVSKEESARIVLSISDLPDGRYILMLTSSNPSDKVYVIIEK